MTQLEWTVVTVELYIGPGIFGGGALLLSHLMLLFVIKHANKCSSARNGTVEELEQQLEDEVV